MNRHRIATLVIPAVILAAALLWSLSILDQLPDRVISRVAFDGQASGYMSPLALILLMVGQGVFLLAVFRPLAVNRFMAGLGGGVSISLAAALVMLLAPQRGATPATELSPAPLLLGMGVAAVVGGSVVAALSDPPPVRREEARDVRRIELGPSSRAVWFSSAHCSGWLRAVLVLGALSGFVFAGLLVPGGRYLGALLLLLAGLALLSFTRLDVRVDARGVDWALLPGLPRGCIPHGGITDVRALHIRPGDWGGWGWRFNRLGQAVLIRGGEGLRIQRGTRNLYLTVDDASRGAALIEAYRSSPGGTAEES